MFIKALIRKVLNLDNIPKKVKYILHFDNRPVKGLSMWSLKMAYMLHPCAVEKRKQIYCFDRKTFEKLLLTDITSCPFLLN